MVRDLLRCLQAWTVLASGQRNAQEIWYYPHVRQGRLKNTDQLILLIGPIVRVNPNEIHFDDPEYYNKIYNNTGKWSKDDRFERQFFGMGSIASTAAHDVHKGRRGILNPYFSRSSVDELQPSIRWHLKKMCRRIREYREEGKVVPLNTAFASLGADIITNYLMPQPYYLLDTPGFSPSYFHMMRAVNRYSQTAKNFAWLYPLLETIPRWLGRFISPIGTINLEDQDVWHPYLRRVFEMMIANILLVCSKSNSYVQSAP